MSAFIKNPVMANYLRKIKKHNYVTLGILVLVYLGSLLSSGYNRVNSPRKINRFIDTPYAGSASCMSCHKDIYESHIKTAHYLTSRIAERKYIRGSFEAGKNSFRYNKFMNVVLQQKDNGFFQTGYINGEEYQSEPFNVVVGSGRKGQTYAYWSDDKLFQLPVSYYVPLDSWCNSPGYTTNIIRFDRNIGGNCIECHGTYAKTEEDADGTTIFDKNSIIYGVDCERCHGAAAAHVAYQINNPNEKTGKYIINPKQLSRQQRLDACALCHSGQRQRIKPVFTFHEGDKLDDFSVPMYNDDTAAALDVHGNQYGLLTASKCFKSSEMDCSSCHNVHVNEVNSPKLFSQRCMNCHTEASHHTCTMPATAELTLSDNCVDCHMPLLPSNKIFLQLPDPKKSTPDYVRTHRIGIYPEQAKAFIRKLNNK